MKKNSLIEFYDNYANIEVFERKRKIYDLTNNLDLDLLIDLKKAFSGHYIKKIEEIAVLFQKDENSSNFGELHIQTLSLMSDYTKDKKTIIQDTFLHYKKTGAQEGKENELIEASDEKLDSQDDEGDDFIETYEENLDLKGRDDNNLTEALDEILISAEYDLIKDIFEETSEFIDEIEELIRRSKKLPKNFHLLEKDEYELIDLSESTITIKIICLKKLGVIDFLRAKQPFVSSINSLANVISLFTGGNSTTVQPMLNAMLGKEVDTKKNPMLSVKTVKTVVDKLINIGYNPEPDKAKYF